MLANIGEEYGHYQTMSLASVGGATIGNKRKVAAVKATNRVDDIEGAVGGRREARFVNKPDLYETRDIAGSTPRVRHPDLKKVSRVCTNADIEGSMPKPYTFKTQRAVNPLNPTYTISDAPIRPATPPKYIRDNIDASDIDGARPAPYHKWAKREAMKTDDIEGAHAGWKPRHRRADKGKPDQMDVNDITKPGFKSRRVTDPLDPVHVINGLRIEGEKGMKPKGLPPAHSGPSLSLTTQDIEGANAGFVPKHVMGGIHPDRRRHFRNVNFVADIEGAVTGSRNLGIRTKRVTDPNNPNYPMLDGAVHSAPTTPAIESRKLMDPKDQEIQRLRSEVERLAKDREILSLQAEIERLKGAPSRGGSRGSLVSRASRRSGGSRGAAGDGFAGGAGAAGGEVRLQSRGSDRLVLRSSDGRPRVPLDDPETGAVADAGAGTPPPRPPSHGSGRPASHARRRAAELAPVDTTGRGASRGSASVGALGATTGSIGGGAPARAATPGAAFGRTTPLSGGRRTPSVRGTPRAESFHSRPASVAGSGRALSVRSAGAGSFRAATPSQRRAVEAYSSDMAEVAALPDRPTSTLSGAGRDSFRA